MAPRTAPAVLVGLGDDPQRPIMLTAAAAPSTPLAELSPDEAGHLVEALNSLLDLIEAAPAHTTLGMCRRA
jgi:hypothetical protein